MLNDVLLSFYFKQWDPKFWDHMENLYLCVSFFFIQWKKLKKFKWIYNLGSVRIFFFWEILFSKDALIW